MGILFNVRKCANCGNSFTTTTSSKYCTTKCRNEKLVNDRAKNALKGDKVGFGCKQI